MWKLHNCIAYIFVIEWWHRECRGVLFMLGSIQGLWGYLEEMKGRGKIGLHNILVNPEFRWKPSSANMIFFNPDLGSKPTSVNKKMSDLKPRLSCKLISVNVYHLHQFLPAPFFSRPGQSQGLLYRHLLHYLINSLTHGLWKYLYGADTPIVWHVRVLDKEHQIVLTLPWLNKDNLLKK